MEINKMKHFSELSIFDYIVTFFILLGAGVGSFLRRNMTKYSIRKKITILLVDVAGSMSIGTTVFFIIYGWTGDLAMSAGASSLLAHIGSRSFYLMELVIADKLNSQALREAVNEYYKKKDEKE